MHVVDVACTPVRVDLASRFRSVEEAGEEYSEVQRLAVVLTTEAKIYTISSDCSNLNHRCNIHLEYNVNTHFVL